MKTRAPVSNHNQLKRAGRDRIGVVGRVAEIKTAKRLGGHQTPASGAMQGAKGDIRRPEFLIENKSTVRDSFSVSLQVLAKIHQEARAKGKAPALAFQFVQEDGTPHRFGAWVAIPEWMFKELEEAYMGAKEE